MSKQRVFGKHFGRRCVIELWENSLRDTNYPHISFVTLAGDSWFPIMNSDYYIIDVNMSEVDEDIHRFFREQLDDCDIMNWSHKDSIEQAKHFTEIDLQGVKFLQDWQEEPCYRALEKWYTEYIDNVSESFKKNFVAANN